MLIDVAILPKMVPITMVQLLFSPVRVLSLSYMKNFPYPTAILKTILYRGIDLR